jgi:hypothetical protein
MWVRIASFEGGDTERLRQMNEEAMSSGTMDTPDGMKRVLVLADSEGKRRQFISFFDTREQIEAGAQKFEEMGDQIPEEVRGRRTSVDVYEVVYEGEM